MIRHALNLAKAVIRDKITGGKRSLKWPGVEKKYLQEFPTCAACGSNKKLNVHHIKPFHLNPELELNYDNLITLCMDNDCHLLIGHGNNFRAYNPNVKEDAKVIAKNISNLKIILAEVAEKAKQNRLFE